MKPYMGQLLKRVFLNTNIINDHFIDICFSPKKERLLWYCRKDEHCIVYGICLDEKMQENFYKKIKANWNDEDFEEKIQKFFSKYIPEDYYKVVLEFFDSMQNLNVVPHHVRFDRECDPHVLMVDRQALFYGLSENHCENFLFELIMNSIQEFQINEATKIDVNIKEDIYDITDDGSGIPVEDSKRFKDYEWKRILTYPHIVFEYPEYFSKNPSAVKATEYFDGDFSNAGFYKKCPQYYHRGIYRARWLPGDTLAHAQCYSKTMNITTIRNNKQYDFEFKNGYCISGRVENEISELKRGTRITWVPDECFFNDTTISFDSLSSFLKQQAFLNAGLKITLNYNGTTVEYFYKNGLKDYLSEKCSIEQTEIARRKFKFSTEYNESNINNEELELCIAIGEYGFLEAYHNYKKMHYGSTVDDVYEEIAYWFNHYIKREGYNNIHKDYNEINFTGEDMKKCFCIVIASLSNESTYTNNTCKGLNNILFQDAIKLSIQRILNGWFDGWIKNNTLVRIIELLKVL